METSTDALIREFHEEIKAYRIHLKDEQSIPLDGSFWGYDELDNGRTDLEFCWVPLQELENGLKVYPLGLIPHILKQSKEIFHFIYKEV
ncbi:MAG: hypothetical protein GX175_11990 [Halanaerobiaceae bacterium]|jgi:fumarate hydratase class II|nr:hypothetical protein [Halanaerobiaceae bacterium]